ncbi:DivIVA domain-containing protein [Dermatophilaceae bacterium Sec6.4]
MALTPEDVVKKEFTKPKGFGRSGYDEIQVDDFLDEIVAELRRLNTENEDLTGKLEDSRRSSGVAGKDIGSTPASAASGIPDVKSAKGDGADKTQAVPAVALSKDTAASDSSANGAALVKAREDLAGARRELQVAKDEREKVQREVVQAKERLAELQKQIDAAEAGLKESGAGVGKAQGISSAAVGTNSAAGVIALAQRLHDEHVKEGETTRDRLIKEAREKHSTVIAEATAKRDELLTSGKSKHEELIREANERSTGLVKEAEDRKKRILGELTTQREEISSGIQRLQTFENEYRSKLTVFIDGQLQYLNQDSDVAPDNLVDAKPGDAAADKPDGSAK